MKLKLIHLIPVLGYFFIRNDWFPYQSTVAYHLLEIYHAIFMIFTLVPVLMAAAGLL
jgi:hypothetical protein